jgi:hypothetical protein
VQDFGRTVGVVEGGGDGAGVAAGLAGLAIWKIAFTMNGDSVSK